MEGFIRGSTVHVGSGFIHGGPAGEIDVVTGEAGGVFMAPRRMGMTVFMAPGDRFERMYSWHQDTAGVYAI